jgi:hypothetical protein
LVNIIGEGDGDLGTHKLAAMLLIILTLSNPLGSIYP